MSASCDLQRTYVAEMFHYSIILTNIYRFPSQIVQRGSAAEAVAIPPRGDVPSFARHSDAVAARALGPLGRVERGQLRRPRRSAVGRERRRGRPR